MTKRQIIVHNIEKLKTKQKIIWHLMMIKIDRCFTYTGNLNAYLEWEHVNVIWKINLLCTIPA